MVTLLCVDEQMGSRIRHVLVWTAGTQGSHRKGMIRVRENEGFQQRLSCNTSVPRHTSCKKQSLPTKLETMVTCRAKPYYSTNRKMKL